MNDLNKVIEGIASLPSDWHKSGSISQSVLNTILKHAKQLKNIEHTAETGSGKSTLLFSHISPNHLVFSLDNGDSMSAVKGSNLFRSERVTFIEGPTQKTLPAYKFSEKFDIVLIDGPHGYPFPDLEYFYFYPQIKTGGLLLVDDIAIPTIKSMFKILKAAYMWELLEVVDNFAVFKRTESPLIDPYSDSWWLQGFNQPFERKSQRKAKIKKFIPQSITSIIPGFIKNIVTKIFGI